MIVFSKEQPKMSAVPQGAFAAFKTRRVLEEVNSQERNETKTEIKHFLSAETGPEQPPMYSSKLMNSIWGLYNQYSVHNIKNNKNSDDE